VIPEPSPFPDTSADATMAQLEPFQAQIREILSTAVVTFNMIQPSLLLPLVRWNRSRATCIWAYAMEGLEQAFPQGGPVKLDVKYETITIHVGTNLVARLKKMTPAGFTSNYPTRRARQYHTADQGELFVLQWAKPLRVDIGYVLNDTGTGVEQVLVAHRKTPQIIDWVREIPAPDSGAPIPLAKQPVPADGSARVQARRAGNTQKESKVTGQ
jgi:hypothetical protein